MRVGSDIEAALSKTQINKSKNHSYLELAMRMELKPILDVLIKEEYGVKEKLIFQNL